MHDAPCLTPTQVQKIITTLQFLICIVRFNVSADGPLIQSRNIELLLDQLEVARTAQHELL
jgi:hypothetical protein